MPTFYFYKVLIIYSKTGFLIELMIMTINANINMQYKWSINPNQTRGMFLLKKAKRPLKFKMLCGFNKHAVKLRMHKAAPYASQYILIHFEAIKATIKEI